ncbi:hypothetical protein SNEBB_005708 [Seison nebaliae]|nr:hypothetical protein SNEBB_005708 [Seison nebaliae]
MRRFYKILILLSFLLFSFYQYSKKEKYVQILKNDKIDITQIFNKYQEILKQFSELIIIDIKILNTFLIHSHSTSNENIQFLPLSKKPFENQVKQKLFKETINFVNGKLKLSNLKSIPSFPNDLEIVTFGIRSTYCSELFNIYTSFANSYEKVFDEIIISKIDKTFTHKKVNGEESLEEYLKNLNVKLNSTRNDCPDHLIFILSSIVIHINVLWSEYSKNSFLIFPFDDNSRIRLNSIQPILQYGNNYQIIHSFPIEKLNTTKKNLQIFYPLTLKNFIGNYPQSKLLLCRNGLHHGERADYDYKVLSLYFIQRQLARINKKSWIDSGTLLGWYRDCNIIPHTKDNDIGLLLSEFDENVENVFKTNRNPLNVFRAQQLGSPQLVLEYRLTDKFGWTTDLIFYKTNPENRKFLLAPFFVHGKIFKFTISKFREYCHGLIDGFPLIVPCNSRRYIVETYGTHRLWMRNEEWTKQNKKLSLTEDISWPYGKRIRLTFNPDGSTKCLFGI